MPQLDPTVFAPQLVWLAITFIALYVILSKFALPKIGGIIAERKSRIDDDLAQAAKLREDAEKALEAYEAALADARSKALAIAQQARDAANETIAAQEAELDAKLASHLAAAEKRLADTRDEALQQVQVAAVNITGDIVAAATGKEVSEKSVQDALHSVQAETDAALKG